MSRELVAFDNFMKDIFDIANVATNVGRNVQEYGAKNLVVDYDSNEDGYVVRAEVPGLDEENIDVGMENGVLTIKAEYKEETKNCLRTGKYRWSARVLDVDADAITAKLDKGILTINLPKSEKAKPKKIEIAK